MRTKGEVCKVAERESGWGSAVTRSFEEVSALWALVSPALSGRSLPRSSHLGWAARKDVQQRRDFQLATLQEAPS